VKRAVALALVAALSLAAPASAVWRVQYGEVACPKGSSRAALTVWTSETSQVGVRLTSGQTRKVCNGHRSRRVAWVRCHDPRARLFVTTKSGTLLRAWLTRGQTDTICYPGRRR
jgi:hypothetical protein